jgi:hypothetical protein
MSAPSFSNNTPNKIGKNIDVSGKHTLIKTEDDSGNRVAIADEPIDAKVGGKKMFCVRLCKTGEDTSDNPYWDDTDSYSGYMMIGFTPMETFDSTKDAWFGENGFTGCGIELSSGRLVYRGSNDHSIINYEISRNATEIIVILTKKEIRFLCDGKESETFNVSKHLQGDRLFPAIVLGSNAAQITTIPIDQIQNKTPEIENLIKEYRQQQNNKNNSQSDGAVASSSTSAAMIQLQKDLDEALQKIAALSSQLQQEKQKSSDLEKEVQQLKQQLSSS